jgi:hypothetical protein
VNPRERLLAFGLLAAVIAAGGGFLFYRFLLGPLRDREAAIHGVKDELERKRENIHQVLAQKPKLDRWRQLSLPADIDLAAREYDKYLEKLFRDSGFADASFSVVPKAPDSKASPALPGKGPIYTRLTFTVLAHGKLDSLVQMMDGFYRTGLLHLIKNLTIQRPLTVAPGQQPGDLDINLTIEALSITGAGNRPYLLPNVEPRLLILDSLAALTGGPAGTAAVVHAGWAAGPTGPNGPGTLAEPSRHYAAVADKNIFLGSLQPEGKNDVDVTRFVHLTDITKDDRRWEAFLYDRYNNRKTRLRAEAGFDSFRITDDAGEAVVHGKVVRIEARDLVFRVNDKYYGVHVGQSLEEAMKKALPAEQVRSMGLAAAPRNGNAGQ